MQENVLGTSVQPRGRHRGLKGLLACWLRLPGAAGRAAGPQIWNWGSGFGVWPGSREAAEAWKAMGLQARKKESGELRGEGEAGRMLKMALGRASGSAGDWSVTAMTGAAGPSGASARAHLHIFEAKSFTPNKRQSGSSH